MTYAFNQPSQEKKKSKEQKYFVQGKICEVSCVMARLPLVTTNDCQGGLVLATKHCSLDRIKRREALDVRNSVVRQQLTEFLGR